MIGNSKNILSMREAGQEESGGTFFIEKKLHSFLESSESFNMKIAFRGSQKNGNSSFCC